MPLNLSSPKWAEQRIQNEVLLMSLLLLNKYLWWQPVAFRIRVELPSLPYKDFDDLLSPPVYFLHVLTPDPLYALNQAKLYANPSC